MRQFQKTISIRSRGRGMLEVTDNLTAAVNESGIQTGMCFIFCRHTSASLLIQENADPSVQTDLLGWLARLAPDGDPRYVHDSEGPDDMAAHLASRPSW